MEDRTSSQEISAIQTEEGSGLFCAVSAESVVTVWEVYERGTSRGYIDHIKGLIGLKGSSLTCEQELEKGRVESEKSRIESEKSRVESGKSVREALLSWDDEDDEDEDVQDEEEEEEDDQAIVYHLQENRAGMVPKSPFFRRKSIKKFPFEKSKEREVERERENKTKDGEYVKENDKGVEIKESSSEKIAKESILNIEKLHLSSRSDSQKSKDEIEEKGEPNPNPNPYPSPNPYPIIYLDQMI
jgi:hypothetical protein